MAQVQIRMQSASPTVAAAAPGAQLQRSPNSGMITGVTVPAPASKPSAAAVEEHGAVTATVAAAMTGQSGGAAATPLDMTVEASASALHNQDTSNTGMANTKEKTPMCLVNELARFNKIQHQYHLTDEDGPAHKKVFTVLLRLGEEEYQATGLSIKKAQHSAASSGLEKTNYKHPPLKTRKTTSKLLGDLAPTVELNALAMKRGEPAVYSVLESSRVNPCTPQNMNYRGAYNQRSMLQKSVDALSSVGKCLPLHVQFTTISQCEHFFFSCVQLYHYPRYPPRLCYISLRVGSRVFVGEGYTTQIARHNAAEKALKTLQEIPMPDEENKEGEGEIGAAAESPPPTSLPKANGVAETLTTATDELKSPISLVHEMALRHNFSVNFEVTRESGPPHMRTFVTRCTVGSLVAEGEGNGKKLSKKRAGERMLEELKKLPPLPLTSVKVKKKPNTVKRKSRNLIKEQKANPDYGQGINPISRLIQVQQAKKEKDPVYSLVAESGLPCRREFVMQVQVGNTTCTGTGSNKKLAKRAAAEGLLQVLGYSRPQPQPTRPTTKTALLEGEVDKNKKVTFVDGDGGCSDKGDGESRGGRQLVPGLLLMPEVLRAGEPVTRLLNYQNNHVGAAGQNVGMTSSIQDATIATIAKELLDHGASPTAEGIRKSGQKLCLPQSVISPKQQLAYLADVLGFTIQFTDFPRGNKREFLSLVSLSTNPPQVCHGAGETLEASHDQAALTALKTFTELGLDSTVKPNNELLSLSGITGDASLLLPSSQNGTAMQASSVVGELMINKH